jgi:phosphoglycerate dehydrogenase-like enzyme
MRTVMVIHPTFDEVWPFAAARVRAGLEQRGPVEVIRLDRAASRTLSAAVPQPGSAGRVIALGMMPTPGCAAAFTPCAQIVVDAPPGEAVARAFTEREIGLHFPATESFWGQSVAEFALGLTLGALRRIPQTHHQMLGSLAPWDYAPGSAAPGSIRGWQYGDDDRFTSGTLAGKRVRLVGAGNIGSRYASWCAMLGAEVAAWDPFAPDPCFHRAGARRELDLGRLVTDAEIFAPMVPLTDKTAGLVTAQHLAALPRGCLVVLVTRAQICNTAALRARVLANELALAADVFDVEPLPLDDPLLGRDNVVHTPHNAGRTRQANEQFAETLLSRLPPT